MLNYEELIGLLDLKEKYIWTVSGDNSEDGSREVLIWNSKDRYGEEPLKTSINVLTELIDNADGFDVADPNEFMRFKW